MYTPPETFGVNLVRMTPDGDLHAKRNMALCTALDLTKLGIVLDDMAKSQHISPRQAENFRLQAGALLATMLAENHRSFIGSSQQSTGSEVRRFGVESIPPWVYWSAEHGNFYDQGTSNGMGVEFINAWRHRKDEFPTSAIKSLVG